MTIFLKGIAGGLIAVLAAWVLIVATIHVRIAMEMRKQQIEGLYAVAGGWTNLLQRPVVVVVLAAAFGIGLYAAVRWSLPR